MRKFNQVEVGARLKEAREALGLKQVDVAAKIGVQPPQWNRFEKGERLITPEAAKAFGDAYGFDLNFVFVGSEAGLSQEVRDKLSIRRRKSA